MTKSATTVFGHKKRNTRLFPADDARPDVVDAREPCFASGGAKDGLLGVRMNAVANEQ